MSTQKIKSIKSKMKLFVWVRDNFTCQYCGLDMKKSYQDWLLGKTKRKFANITVDHIIPKSEGGEWLISNLITACYPCNQSKASRIYATPKPIPFRGKTLIFRLLGVLVVWGEWAKKWRVRNSSYSWQDK